MNVLLQKHGAKHIYKVPEGLRELCADIAREVLRSQPRNIYCFVADYVEALLITRENAKVAVKVVNNILLRSQAIVGILYRSGLSLEQIACAAPRIQKAFRAYLDAVDMQAYQVCDDDTCDEKSRISLQNILRATGTPLKQAKKYAMIIQAAFRGHYERMLLNESRGMIQWQRAATKTLEILRKAGASQAEASKAAILIQATYRGYYTRRNLKMKMMAMQTQEEKEGDLDMIEPRDAIPAVAWLDMMYEESGLTEARANEAALIIQRAYRRYRQKKKKKTPQIESIISMVAEGSGEEPRLTEARANEAASIIQRAYRRYRQKKKKYTPQIESIISMVAEGSGEKPRLTEARANEAASIIQRAYRRYRQKKKSTRSMVAEAIVKNLHQKIFDEVITHADIPTEFGNREDLTNTSKKFQRTLKDRLTHVRIMEEGYNEQEFVRTEAPELFTKLENTYSNGGEHQEEGRKIEVEREREETYVRD
ncbi:abnormal spindle-like microcephaly-associated protein homolog [Camponotus floridanus]|uniref:abnormal spindle-like microcephaly-associated protein homolog n=1 Tax=Camponotus floridanus TaxID=104421 RepID=UPI000DC6A3B7|nr:abnormal spindle-like microcephaly-associated protein homolog [Camponotus floridanus]